MQYICPIFIVKISLIPWKKRGNKLHKKTSLLVAAINQIVILNSIGTVTVSAQNFTTSASLDEMRMSENMVITTLCYSISAIQNSDTLLLIFLTMSSEVLSTFY